MRYSNCVVNPKEGTAMNSAVEFSILHDLVREAGYNYAVIANLYPNGEEQSRAYCLMQYARQALRQIHPDSAENFITSTYSGDVI